MMKEWRDGECIRGGGENGKKSRKLESPPFLSRPSSFVHGVLKFLDAFERVVTQAQTLRSP